METVTTLIAFVLLAAAVFQLERTHRRGAGLPSWRPGADTRDDPDLRRLRQDLNQAASPDPGTTPTTPTGAPAPRTVHRVAIARSTAASSTS